MDNKTKITAEEIFSKYISFCDIATIDYHNVDNRNFDDLKNNMIEAINEALSLPLENKQEVTEEQINEEVKEWFNTTGRFDADPGSYKAGIKKGLSLSPYKQEETVKDGFEKVLSDLIYTASTLWDGYKSIKDSDIITATHPIIEEAKSFLSEYHKFQPVIEVKSAEENDTFDKIFANHLEWTRATFPKATSFGALLHAQREIMEVIDDINNNAPAKQKATEFGDVIFCNIDGSDREKITLDLLKQQMRKKLDKNKTRKWKDNGDGSYSHIKEASQSLHQEPKKEGEAK